VPPRRALVIARSVTRLPSPLDERLMIRRRDDRDFDVIRAIIDDAAQAYRGIIRADRWTEAYMSADHHLQHEIDDGVVFWG
jgi:hypothetical protein